MAPAGEHKRTKRRAVIPLALWDSAWKLAAVRRAWKRKEYRWLVTLAFTSTGGLLPMYYLWRTRGGKAEE